MWLRASSYIRKSILYSLDDMSTFNGCGTKFYGQRDFEPDGTYVTTEWLVLLYIPIIPISSLRVAYTGPGEQRWYGIYSSSSHNYAIYKRTFPNWKQVLFTYAYLVLVAGWAYLVGATATSISHNAFNSVSSVWIIFIACMVPVPAPWMLRYFAQKKLRNKTPTR